jgi:hypothetical protein
MMLNVDSGRPVSKDQIGAMIATCGAYANAIKEASASSAAIRPLLIPSLFDQDPWAQSRRPSDMMRQG